LMLALTHPALDPSRRFEMEQWHLSARDLKTYPHFDPIISRRIAEAYATNANLVARHAFFPFIQYKQLWTRFRKPGEKRDVKVRPIRYAARRDAYIFLYYRCILSEFYEAELERLGLRQNVLAYRQIPLPAGKGGKCNIHFAYDAISKIKELGRCSAISLDISDFFESLDHDHLKGVWCRMLGVTRLPPDHFNVFKAITNYAWVDKEAAYERLGHFGEKLSKDGRTREKGYTTPYRKVPKQLCDAAEFRRKIAGWGDLGSIIKKNDKTFGIPQGAPISDILANLYLLDFDDAVAGRAKQRGGAYFRYSDDILIAIPGDQDAGETLMSEVCELIRKFGSELRIKDKKTSLITFRQVSERQTFLLNRGTQGRNGLEYLGFRYDGKKVFLRDATLSRLRRKVARAARRDAEACARRYPDKNLQQLKILFNYERLIKKFGRVEEFDATDREYRKWTFWTYAKRASQVFGVPGRPILRQLRKHRQQIRHRADIALERAVARRDQRKRTPKHQHNHEPERTPRTEAKIL
jgi:Reverse transcriptase (RNA-dependent DNA polymerase)